MRNPVKALVFIATITFSGSVFAQDMNFRFSPLGVLVGAINVSLDYQISPNWTLGPQLVYWNIDVDREGVLTEDISIKAIGGGVRGNWFKNGTYTEGLYVGPALDYVSVEASSSDAFGTVEGDVSTLVASGIVGYGWFWESFNILLGGGLSIPLGEAEVTVRDSSGTETKSNVGSGLAAEFSLGWTF